MFFYDTQNKYIKKVYYKYNFIYMFIIMKENH